MRADAVALCEAEEGAAAIRCYGSYDIPQALWADGYARQRWAWAAQHRIWRPAADVAAELMPRRQATLQRTSSVHRSFVVSEGAIMDLETTDRDLGVALSQLLYLRDLTDDLLYSVRILQSLARLPSEPGPAFTIMTDRAGRETLFVNSLDPNHFMPVRDERRVREAARLFAELNDHCFDQVRSRARISCAIRRCHDRLAADPPTADDQPVA